MIGKISSGLTELPQRDSILPEGGSDGSDGVDFEALDDATSDRQHSDALPAEGVYSLAPATLLGRLQIERDEAGGPSIRAPAQIAGTIADLFETMAMMLRKNA